MRYISTSLLSLFIISCSTIKVSNRREKDIAISSTNFQKINGKYQNIPFDTAKDRRLLWYELNDSTEYSGSSKNTFVQVKVLDDKKLEMSLLLNDSLVAKGVVKGTFKRGYFSVKRQLDTKFVFGPLLWTFGEKKILIGISKGDNLVLLSSSSNTALLVFFPISGAGDSNIESYYQRVD